MAEVAWNSGDPEASLQWGELALEDALEAAAARQRLQVTDTLSVASRQMLGLARAWAGDTAGVELVAKALNERRDRLNQGDDFAEYLWHVRDLHLLLLRYQRYEEAASLKRSSPRAFSAPYPNS
jgi:hypothetical protein